MKKTLMVLCSAVVLVGCDQNRGGLGDNSSRDAGGNSSRNTTAPSSSTLDRNDSSVISTNTNAIAPAQTDTGPAKPDQGGTDYK